MGALNHRLAADNTLVIEAGVAQKEYWKDLWRYRQLFYFLPWRDITIRYEHTALGILWSIVRPLATMVIFTLVFGHWAQLTSNGVPYSLMVLAGLVPWQFFSTGLWDGSNSLLNNASLITKIYFPRIIIPISALMVNVLDTAVAFVFLIVLMGIVRVIPSLNIIYLPFFILNLGVLTLGASFWLSALHAKYRDFKNIIPFALQLWLYVSPVAFASQIVPQKWRLLFFLNPIAGVIEGFRWTLLPLSVPLEWQGCLLSLWVSIVLLVSGFQYFRQVERTIADII